jgi:hypothetical protein
MAKNQNGLTQWFKEKWVDLSRPKEGGGFEPCGREDASGGKYPKCVPAARAARMTPEQIESAIRRKRMAESREKREGKKPIMVPTVKKESKAVPTDPELYARVKAAAKKKFDVYPSAYANGWLVAEYKRRGGKYRMEKVELEKYNPYRDEKGRFASSNRASSMSAGAGLRTEVGAEGVEIQLAPPMSNLSRHHGEQRDWSKVSAVDPNKRAMVAKAYAKMKDIDDSPEVKKSWDDAEVEIKRQFKQLQEVDGIKVEFVNNDPYKDFHDMHKQVSETGTLKVLKTEVTGGHPYWSNKTNDMFRAVHDAYGHLGTGRGFDRHGEEAAYQAHRSMFPESAQRALATELRGQNQFLIQNGFFGEQKLGFLPANLQKRYALIMSKSMPAKKTNADDDNAYSLGRSHHVSGGRHFASARNLKKDSPTPTDVHVPAIMGARKKQRDLKKKRMKMDMAVTKKEPLKDPKGGLTAAGRAKFNRETGSKLRPGVMGAADTPTKMRRKGSFLTRFFTNPSGPMVKPNGEPTRQALSAAAWGEPVPKNVEDAKALAAKGRRLLERYENSKEK